MTHNGAHESQTTGNSSEHVLGIGAPRTDITSATENGSASQLNDPMQEIVGLILKSADKTVSDPEGLRARFDFWRAQKANAAEINDETVVSETDAVMEWLLQQNRHWSE